MDGEWCYQDDPCRGCTIVVLQARVTALEEALRQIQRVLGSRVPFWQEDIVDALALIEKALGPGAGGAA